MVSFKGHGKDGLGDISLAPEFKAPHIQPQEEHAVNAMIRLVNQHPGEVHIIALGSFSPSIVQRFLCIIFLFKSTLFASFVGPLSNVALATAMDASFATKVASLFIMGGTHRHTGNVGLISEFNMYVFGAKLRSLLGFDCRS